MSDCCTCLFFGPKWQTLPFQLLTFTHQGAPGDCHGYTLKSGCSSLTNTIFLCSSVNFDYLGPLEGTGRTVFILHVDVVKGFQYKLYKYMGVCFITLNGSMPHTHHRLKVTPVANKYICKPCCLPGFCRPWFLVIWFGF